MPLLAASLAVAAWLFWLLANGVLGRQGTLLGVVSLVAGGAALSWHTGRNFTGSLILVGFGASDLDDYTRDAAGEQGRVIRPDAEPEKGSFYRSDHFSFAKQGVPALDPDTGIDFVGQPAGYGQKVIDDYTARRYHQPSDLVTADWDLSGAREDLKVFLAVGDRVADADTFPAWKPGNEFKATRDAMLRK